MAFTIATWNMLATACIRSGYYPMTPEEFLDPIWRIPALVAYAGALGADILCLQEVEYEVFKALQKGMQGYQGVHALRGGYRPEGCATIFRSAAFTLLNHRVVDYRDQSGHIAQSVLLEHGGKRLAIANTHLQWYPPDTPRERREGYRQILQAMQTFDREDTRSDGQVISGDFNVTAESDVVAALLDAGFDYAHRNMLGIASCYSNGRPRLVDYLFSRGPLEAHAIAPPELDGLTYLPSHNHPSDHLPVLARFHWS